MRYFNELYGEMQAAVNFVVVDVNKEMQALWAFETTQMPNFKLMGRGSRLRKLNSRLVWSWWAMMDRSEC